LSLAEDVDAMMKWFNEVWRRSGVSEDQVRKVEVEQYSPSIGKLSDSNLYPPNSPLCTTVNCIRATFVICGVGDSNMVWCLGKLHDVEYELPSLPLLVPHPDRAK
jgi:hypothetical protein